MEKPVTGITFSRYLEIITRKKPPQVGTEQKSLHRTLNLFDLTLLNIAITTGGGIYIILIPLIRSVAGPALVLSFVLAAMPVSYIGLCYSQFSSQNMRTGSTFVIVYSVFGEVFAFLIGWNYFIEIVMSLTILSMSFSDYMKSLTGDALHFMRFESMYFQVDFVAIVITIISMTVSLFGMKNSIKTSSMLTIPNILMLIVMIIAGSCKATTENIQTLQDFAPYGIQGIIQGASTVYFCFLGFDSVLVASEQSIKPWKDIPRSIVITQIVVLLLYIGLSLVHSLMVPFNTLQNMATSSDLFSFAGLHWAKYMIDIGVLGMFSAQLFSLFGNIAMVPFSLSRDGLLPEWMSTISKKTEVPYKNVFLIATLVIIAQSFFTVEQLISFLSLGVVIEFSFALLVVIIQRYDYDDGEVTVNSKKCICNVRERNILLYKNTEVRNLMEFSRSGISNQSTEFVDPAEANKRLKSGITSNLFQSCKRKMATCSEKTLLFIITCSSFISIAILNHLLRRLVEGSFFTWLFLVMFLVILISSVSVLLWRPKKNVAYAFTAPGVPVVKLAVLFFNINLLVNFDPFAWIRYISTMLTGLFIYVFYGVLHSTIQEEA